MPSLAEGPQSPLVGNLDEKAAAKVERDKVHRQRLGTLLVLVVVGLYVTSGVMIQVLFDEMQYEKPFFFSFVSVGLCSTYLLQSAAFECRRKFTAPRHAYTKVLQPSAHGGPPSPLQLLRPALLLAPSSK